MKSTEQPFKRFLYILGVFILIVVLIRFQQRVSEMHRLEEQLSLVQAQGTAVVQTQSNLMTQVAIANSDQAVKEWAYREGRWYLPYETPIIIVSDDTNTSETNTTTIEQSAPVQNWQVWWELFFGNKN